MPIMQHAASSNWRPIPAIVVGTGFGCKVHVPALRAAGLEVAALVGTDGERLARSAEESRVPRTFTDLDQAVKETGALVVAVSTPPNTHAPLVLQAIERGCHVLCEKPMALNAQEAQAMLNAAEVAGVMHVIGHEHRWEPDRVLMGRAIADGLIGAPRFLTFIRYIPFVADPSASGMARLPRWWFDKEAGGGWLGASGSHMIDQIRAWLGEFDSLSAALPIVSDRKDVAEDSLVVRFRLKNGLEGVLQETAGAWGPRTELWRIAGTKGTIWSENGLVRLASVAGVAELPVPEDAMLPTAPARGVAESSSRAPQVGVYTRLYEALRAGIEGREIKSAVPLPTFRDGVAHMRVMDAIRGSANKRGALVQVE